MFPPRGASRYFRPLWHGLIVAHLSWSRSLLWFALRQILVQPKANLSILLRLLPQPFGVFRFTLEQHLEASLLLQKVPDFARGSAGVKGQWIFTSKDAFRIVAIEQPLTRLDCDFLI